MQVVNYLYDPQEIVDLYFDYKRSYESKFSGDYNQAVPEIALKYLKSEPKAYLRFGVYYGAVLNALEKLGKLPSGIVNQEPPILINAYTLPSFDDIPSEVLTIIAAFEFKNYYNASLFQGTNTFTPFEDEQEQYLLHDADWELFVTLNQ